LVVQKYEELAFSKTVGPKVVELGLCAGCGACVAFCPYNVLEYVEDHPEEVDECLMCGNCSNVCPRYEFDWDSIENFAFGRTRTSEEEFGVKRKIVIAKSKDEEILRVCQDGGVVSSLLISALEEGLIDGAILSGVSEGKPFYPIPKIAMSREEIVACAGSRYTYTTNMIDLVGAAEILGALGFKGFAFVGLPCQIQASRKIQMLPHPSISWWAKSIKFNIGLFCTETFTYEGLIEEAIHKGLGIKPEEIAKMNIKAKIIITTKSGETKIIPLEEARKYMRNGCKACSDFSAEAADISIGSVGLEGWNLVIIRSEAGEELFKNAVKAGKLETRPIEEEEQALKILLKLTRAKKRRAEKFMKQLST